MIRLNTFVVAAHLLFAICFGSSCATDVSTEPGAIAGVVRFAGKIPKSSIADESGYRRDLLRVDRETRALTFAVIYVESTEAGSIDETASTEAVVVDQIDLAFHPRVVAIRSGQTVAFTNSDPDNHNVRSSAHDSRNRLNIVTAFDREFEKRFFAESASRRIGLSCDVHAWMQAWIYVFEHSYFSVTNAEGAFRIHGLEAGEYRVVIEQPDGGLRTERTIAVRAGETTKFDVEFTGADVALD